MTNLKNKALALTTVILLSACGNTQGDRALSGGAMGAGAGAILSGNPVAGAVVGGAVGAAAGALIPADKVNLGKPVWK